MCQGLKYQVGGGACHFDCVGLGSREGGSRAWTPFAPRIGGQVDGVVVVVVVVGFAVVVKASILSRYIGVENMTVCLFGGDRCETLQSMDSLGSLYTWVIHPFIPPSIPPSHTSPAKTKTVQERDRAQEGGMPITSFPSYFSFDLLLGQCNF